MTTVLHDLYQFSSYFQPIDLTFHQYLLHTEEPVLLHTGNVQQAASLLPELQEQLKGKVLKYIFVSHFEADECGGLAHILEHYPAAQVVCSEVTARQLSGFGITNEFMIKKPGEKLTNDDFELEFFSYPSEMHLWEGLLVMENHRKIFFSSDLMIRFGEAAGVVQASDWQREIENIRPEQVPDSERRALLQQTLAKLKPEFVAVGHGPCLKL